MTEYKQLTDDSSDGYRHWKDENVRVISFFSFIFDVLHTYKISVPFFAYELSLSGHRLPR